MKGAFVHEAKIAKGSSYTLTFVFYGWVKLATNKQVTYKAMWFCPNDKERCVPRDVWDLLKRKVQVPFLNGAMDEITWKMLIQDWFNLKT